MEGWVDLGFAVMHRPGVELAISRSQVRRPNHYTTEPPDRIDWQLDAITCLSRFFTYHTYRWCFKCFSAQYCGCILIHASAFLQFIVPYRPPGRCRPWRSAPPHLPRCATGRGEEKRRRIDEGKASGGSEGRKGEGKRKRMEGSPIFRPTLWHF